MKYKIFCRYKYFPNVTVIELFALAAPTTSLYIRHAAVCTGNSAIGTTWNIQELSVDLFKFCVAQPLTRSIKICC